MNMSEKIYIVICVLFSVLIVVGNLVYQKFVILPILPFYSFELSVGAIFYPLTYLLTDLITEFYGKEKANFCVNLAVSMNITIGTLIYFLDRLTATSWSKVDDAMFHKVFGFYGVAFLGSIVACYISQLVDITLYLLIRKFTKDKYLWLRSNCSTAISLFIDTTIVIGFMTLFGLLQFSNMWTLIFSSYMFKLFFTICSTPIFYLSVFVISSLLKNSVVRPVILA